MKAIGQYDGALQMFVQELPEPDMAKLGFLQWLVQTGRMLDDAIPASFEAMFPAPTYDPRGGYDF